MFSLTEIFGGKVKLMSSHFEFRRITTICENYVKLSRSQTEHRIQGQTLKQKSLSRVSCSNRKKRDKLKTGPANIAETLKQITVSLFLAQTGKKKDKTGD